jgi:hypothetical protein
VQFYLTIKEIEARLNDSSVNLHSFIVSNTPSHVMTTLWGVSKSAMMEQHILFQEEDRDTYIREMLELSLMHAGRGINS